MVVLSYLAPLDDAYTDRDDTAIDAPSHLPSIPLCPPRLLFVVQVERKGETTPFRLMKTSGFDFSLHGPMSLVDTAPSPATVIIHT